jgi:hypothetical protein
MMQMWVSKAKAKELGCTHHALFMGIIPGFYGDADGLWVSRSDLLNPLESLLVFLWTSLRVIRGEEPDFMFMVSREI